MRGDESLVADLRACGWRSVGRAEMERLTTYAQAVGSWRVADGSSVRIAPRTQRVGRLAVMAALWVEHLRECRECQGMDHGWTCELCNGEGITVDGDCDCAECCQAQDVAHRVLAEVTQ